MSHRVFATLLYQFCESGTYSDRLKSISQLMTSSKNHGLNLSFEFLSNPNNDRSIVEIIELSTILPSLFSSFVVSASLAVNLAPSSLLGVST